MGEKAEQKKVYILEQAEKIFAEKGFKNVTMKDVVSVCNISRGGVYLYFNSTDEIFEEILRNREAADHPPLSETDLNRCSATMLIQQFLNAQKIELQNPADSLVIATYEYLFAHSGELNRLKLENKFKTATTQLSELIEYGKAQGEFCVNSMTAAQNIVFLLEGLRLTSTVMTFDDRQIDLQIAYILSQLQGGENDTEKQ